MNEEKVVWYNLVEDIAVSEAIFQYLYRQFDRSLMVLADLTSVLRKWTHLVVLASSEIYAVGVVFKAFTFPVVAIVSNESSKGIVLLEAIQAFINERFTLVLNSADPLTPLIKDIPTDNDLWLTRLTEPVSSIFKSKHHFSPRPEYDPTKLAALYQSCEMVYWIPEMVNFNHYWAIEHNNLLLSAAGLDFILYQRSYAQIGNVATLRQWRRQGLATSCVQSVIASLHSQNIVKCGLFVDSRNEGLIHLYSNMQFKEEGRFLFFTDFQYTSL